MRNVLQIISLLIAGSSMVGAQEIKIEPVDPTAYDTIKVTCSYPFGAFVETHSHSVSGNTVQVNLVQDGWNLHPNPPHSFTERIEPLAAGTYLFRVSCHTGFVEEREVVVGLATGIPTLGPIGVVLLAGLVGFAGFRFLHSR